ADRGLRRGYRHDKKHNHLSVHRAQPAAQRNEGKIDGVEHQLDRHEHHQDVATGKKAPHADRKDQRTERHHVSQLRHRYAAFRAASVARWAISACELRRASATAPTTPTNRRTDATSKASSD